jgi:SAM-dependent methyltransferase
MTGRERTVRHRRLLGLFDQTQGRGLEIGPLFDPVVHRWDGDIRYVDVKSGAELKEYYSAHPDIPLDDIVDPDFVLIGPEGPRTLPEAVRGSEPFDWVIASHVIEHVPDVLGWLREVGEILVDGGRLVLAVPDRRFSFDAARPPTTVGEMLLAHEHQDRIPSVRAIYDHYRTVVSVNAADVWGGHEPGVDDRIHDLDYVRSQLRLAVEDGAYVDCHVWLFTPQSFVDQLAELARLDRLDFVVDQVLPTAVHELEFYAVLRRVPRDLPPNERAAVLADGFALTGLDDRPVPTDGAADDLAAPAGAPPMLPPNVAVLSERERRALLVKRATMGRARAIVARVTGRMRRR